jgi:YfiH family protein
MQGILIDLTINQYSEVDSGLLINHHCSGDFVLIKKEENGITYFQFPNLLAFPEICHGIFTRNNGLSSLPYAGLNVSFDVGDDPSNVMKNRNAISDIMAGTDFVYLRQVHGTDVIVLDDDHFGWNRKAPEGDAVITDKQNISLLITVADCQAVLIYDPVKKVTANIHSGWRGSINNIIGRTIKSMKKRFGSTAEDIVAGIGPSLGPCCAEFVNHKKEIPERYRDFMVNEDHFDFWAISDHQLCDSGVLPENIHNAGMCTKCNTDLFFSYRSEKKTGRFAAVICRV